MTGETKKERHALDRLADSFVDDILGASDDEILAEFAESHGDPSKNAEEMRALFEKALLVANKRRLKAAQAAVAAEARSALRTSAIDIAEARLKLRSILAKAPPGLSLAARNESELSDADVFGTLEDLQELGLWFDDDQGGTK